MSQEYEVCCLCDDPTGHAGRGDGSIYVELNKATIGPLCPECCQDLMAWAQEESGTSEELSRLQEENLRLGKLCRKQQDEIETLVGFADSVESLRDIGRVIGCGHVDDPDGRRQLVNCVEQEFCRLSQALEVST